MLTVCMCFITAGDPTSLTLRGKSFPISLKKKPRQSDYDSVGLPRSSISNWNASNSSSSELFPGTDGSLGAGARPTGADGIAGALTAVAGCGRAAILGAGAASYCMRRGPTHLPDPPLRARRAPLPARPRRGPRRTPRAGPGRPTPAASSPYVR